MLKVKLIKENIPDITQLEEIGIKFEHSYKVVEVKDTGSVNILCGKLVLFFNEREYKLTEYPSEEKLNNYIKFQNCTREEALIKWMKTQIY